MCRYLLVLVAGMVLVSGGSGRTRTRPVANTRANPIPQGNELLIDAQVGQVLRHSPAGAKLFRALPPLQTLPIRLPDNYSLILIDDLDESFTCEGRKYGYYADPANNCQIFHVCVPLHLLYPGNFTTDATLTYSFICPFYTRFSQDTLVCAFVSEALPCEYAEELYVLNEDFFRTVEDENGTRYAKWGESKSKLTP